MKTTCLITSFNYGQFLPAAIDSVLAQSIPCDEIIVVDDGSTDGSAELVRRYGDHPRLRLVTKPNGGQLSCFNAGFAAAAGRLVFFLDADDLLEPRCIEECLRVFEREPSVDFLFWAHRLFGAREGESHVFPRDRDIGYSAARTCYLKHWIGAPTSCLCIRREILHRFLPLPFEDDWRTRADDCLVFGASVVGARKFYLDRVLTRYRVHGNNHFFDRSFDEAYEYRRLLSVNRLFRHLLARAGYDLLELAASVPREFRTVPEPDLRLLNQYCRIMWKSNVSLARKFKNVTAMTRHFLSRARVERERAARAAA